MPPLLVFLGCRSFPKSIACRPFTAFLSRRARALPPRMVIPESDIEESFLKGSGPGGQKIVCWIHLSLLRPTNAMQNKTNSAVQLKHLPTGLVVKFQGQRSRDYNRKQARRILADKLEAMEKGDESRMGLKAQEKARKKASKTKKARRKYKALAAVKEGAKEAEMDGQISGSTESGG
jgi:peptide chain release factor